MRTRWLISLLGASTLAATSVVAAESEDGVRTEVTTTIVHDPATGKVMEKRETNTEIRMQSDGFEKTVTETITKPVRAEGTGMHAPGPSSAVAGVEDSKGATEEHAPDAGKSGEVAETTTSTTRENGEYQSVKALNKIREDLEGFHFGVALGTTVDLGKHDRIDEAQLVGGTQSTGGADEGSSDDSSPQIVRVKKDSNVRARFMLESHYFFVPRKPFISKEFGVRAGEWGWGPFVSIEPGGSDAIISSVGAGVLFGLRRQPLIPLPTDGDSSANGSGNKTEDGGSQAAPPATDSFNLGIGVEVDPDVQVLGDGIKANQPLPDGETSIRYRNTEQVGLLFIFSYSF